MEQQKKTSLVQLKAKQSHVMYTVCVLLNTKELLLEKKQQQKNSIIPVLHRDQKVLGYAARWHGQQCSDKNVHVPIYNELNS